MVMWQIRICAKLEKKESKRINKIIHVIHKFGTDLERLFSNIGNPSRVVRTSNPLNLVYPVPVPTKIIFSTVSWACAWWVSLTKLHLQNCFTKYSLICIGRWILIQESHEDTVGRLFYVISYYCSSKMLRLKL